MNPTPSPYRPVNSVDDCAISGTLPRPSMSPYSVSPATENTTVRGSSLQYLGCSTYVPTYFARTSRATGTLALRSSDALPTQCASPGLASRSLHTNSIISVSAASSARTETVQGLE